MIRRRIGGGTAAVLLILCLAGPARATEGAPANDSIARPTPIELPSSTVQATDAATAETVDPTACAAFDHSVWFSWTAPTDGPVLVSTAGSDYDTVLVVGTADGAGGMVVVACNDDADGLQSALILEASAGTTYLVMVAGYSGTPGGSLVLSLEEAPPPPIIELSVRAATFDSGGSATISGTLSCEGVPGVGMDLFLTQPVGRQSISGWGGAFVACGPSPVPWSATVAGENGKFLGGPATVSAYVYACNLTGCLEDILTIAVRLRR